MNEKRKRNERTLHTNIVYRAFVRLCFPYSSFVSFRSFVYRAFISCIVHFSYCSCEAFVRFVCVFRSFAFGAYCKLIRSRICTYLMWKRISIFFSKCTLYWTQILLFCVILCPVVVAILKNVNIVRDSSCIVWVQFVIWLKKKLYIHFPIGTHVWLYLEVVDIETKTLVFRTWACTAHLLIHTEFVFNTVYILRKILMFFFT
jgi:hypothetical protein